MTRSRAVAVAFAAGLAAGLATPVAVRVGLAVRDRVAASLLTGSPPPAGPARWGPPSSCACGAVVLPDPRASSRLDGVLAYRDGLAGDHAAPSCFVVDVADDGSASRRWVPRR